MLAIIVVLAIGVGLGVEVVAPAIAKVKAVIAALRAPKV